MIQKKKNFFMYIKYMSFGYWILIIIITLLMIINFNKKVSEISY